MLTILILTTISLGAAGQSLIGVKGGVSFTNVTGSDFAENNDSRIGFSGGLTYEYFLKENHAISFELVINQRGFTNDLIFRDSQGNPTGQKATFKFNYDYLSLPIKTGIYFGKKISGFSNMGIIPSILVNAKTFIPSNGGMFPAHTVDITDRVDKFDFAGLIEIGVNYKATATVWLFSSLTYQYSFTSITNADYLEDDTIRHNGLALLFGLKYKLSKE